MKKDYIESIQLPEKDVFDNFNSLILEEYVVEYENGELFLYPKLISPKRGKEDGKLGEENSVIPLKSFPIVP